MAIPIANTGADIILAYSAAPLSQALTGAASSDPDGGAIVGYSWQLLYHPPGSTASVTNPTTQTPTLTNIDKPGTYRLFLIVEDDGTGNGGVHEFSQSDRLLAPDTAFVQVVMQTQYNSWRIPASGERGWADHLYTPWIEADAITSGAPSNAPYLTNGAVAGLSSEVNIQALSSSASFITSNAAVTPIIAKGAAAQSANLFIAQTSAGTGVFNILPDGNVSSFGTSIELNRDAIASSKEVAQYRLRSGDGVAAPNDDLIISSIELEPELEEIQIHSTRNRNGAGDAFIGSTLVSGKTGTTTLHNSAIKWTAGTGAAALSLTGITDAATAKISFVGDAGIDTWRFNRMDLHVESGIIQADNNIELDGVGDQTIFKTAAGDLKFGTSSGSVIFRSGGADVWRINSASKSLETIAGPYKIEGVNTPTAANDAANKSYVDSQARYTVATITHTASPYAAVHKNLILANATGAVITVNLPAAPVAGDQVSVKKIDGSGNAITVSGNGNTIDGSANATLAAQGNTITVVSDGTNWWSI